MKKRALAFLIAAVICLSLLTACSLGDKKQDPENTDVIDYTAEDFDLTVPVLSIGDKKVPFALYKALYESYLPYMQSTGYDPLADRDSLESFQDWLTESLSKDLVILHQADINGFTLTPEQEEELNEITEEELADLYETYHKYAEEDYEADPTVTVEAYFSNYIQKMSEYYTGVKMDWEEYKEEYKRESRKSFIIDHYKDEVCREFVPTDDDVQSWYDERYESNKSSYSQYPGKYKVDEEYYELYAGQKDDAYPVLFVPRGYCRVMEIIVTPQGELSDNYNKNIERMDKIKQQYADLAFEDALAGTNANAAAIETLLNEYRELQKETDREFAAYTAAARDKMQQAYTALEAGQPFAEVMLEYTEDTDVTGDDTHEGCRVFQEKGRLISTEHESTRDWSEGVKEVFAKLMMGEYSEIFYDEGSYHILYYVSEEPAGDVGIDEVYSDIKAICQTGVNNSQWDALVEEWLNDPELVKNMELIRAVGAADVSKE